MKSVEKLVGKYYKTEEKQRRMLEMLHRKLDNLEFVDEMFTSYSQLFLYEKDGKQDSRFQSDYLLVNENGKRILHLGIVHSKGKKNLYHCNSFMTTYQNDRDKDCFYCDLSHCYEINKIEREDKVTREKEIIYVSEK